MFQTIEIEIRISQKHFKYTLKECYADAYVKFSNLYNLCKMLFETGIRISQFQISLTFSTLRYADIVKIRQVFEKQILNHFKIASRLAFDKSLTKILRSILKVHLHVRFQTPISH
jgi:hypothetical protein